MASTPTRCRPPPDGIKKLGILATLLKSRGIAKDTVLFVDEPETNLHPRASAVFTQVLFRLGQAGVQVYLATHSYFVLKQLEILAKQHKMDVPFCSLVREGDEIDARFSNLREGMPDNPIIDESLRLYQEGIDVDFGDRRARLPRSGQGLPGVGALLRSPERSIASDSMKAAHKALLFNTLGIQEMDFAWWDEARADPCACSK